MIWQFGPVPQAADWKDDDRITAAGRDADWQQQPTRTRARAPEKAMLDHDVGFGLGVGNPEFGHQPRDHPADCPSPWLCGSTTPRVMEPRRVRQYRRGRLVGRVQDIHHLGSVRGLEPAQVATPHLQVRKVGGPLPLQVR